MLNVTAEVIAGSMHQLPTLRPIVLKLLESFDNPGIDTQSLVHEIAQDQALVTRVLRLANSSFYGLPSHVDSLKDAVMILGFRTVRAVAVAVSLTDCFSSRKVAGFDTQTFWRHCAATGMAAREIAAIVRRPTDVAFTAGIIHDMGILALLWLYPQAMEKTFAASREHRLALVVAERETLGVDHCQVGAVLARRWGLPPALVEAVALHEEPAPAVADSLADIVHLANVVVHDYGLPEMDELHVSLASDISMNRLGLDGADVRRVVDRLDRDLDSTFQVLFG
jgi:HD-like signal output (HDOD) protein